MKKLISVLLVGTMCLLVGASALAYNESPMLRTKVAAGELPPVEQRLPDEPRVLVPPASLIESPEIGQYGGTVNVFASDNLPWGDLLETTSRGSCLLQMEEDGQLVPDLVQGYEVSDDQKNFTFYLRKGMKWSDGYPFTADDILFKYEDMIWDERVETWFIGGERTEPLRTVTKIDDYTIRFEFDRPFPKFLLNMVDWRGGEWMRYSPKHYLKKWHIKYNPEANELAKEEGYEYWWEAFNHHQEVAPTGDINRPTLQPWMFTEFTPTYKVFERNPYYYAVDSAGNQLPYIDRIVSTIVDPEVYQMKIISGESDIAFGQTSFENYALYKENEEEGGYRTVLIPGIFGSEVMYLINQNNPDPVRRKIFQDVRFRKAISLAINREEINEEVYYGSGVPRQATILPSTSYYKEEWGKAYAQYDPDEANKLLDEMGLTERDSRGFRKRPDGETILLILEYVTGGWGSSSMVHELVKEYWEAVGLEVLLKASVRVWEPTGMYLIDSEVNSGMMGGSKEFYQYISSEFWVGWSVGWEAWMLASDDVSAGKKTLADFEGGELPGTEPPSHYKEYRSNRIKRADSEYGSAEYMELSQKMFDYLAEQVYLIGTVGMIPTCYIANKNIGNVPTGYTYVAESADCFNYLSKFLFFKQ